MSDDLWQEAMEMWMDDDYDPLDNSDENFVEDIMSEAPVGTVVVLTPDPQLPFFFTSQWGTLWTGVHADAEIIDRCTFCGRKFSNAMQVFTNREGTLYLCSLCVHIEAQE